MTTNNVPAIKGTATINILAGIWLFVSPWVYLAYGNPNAWNSWIVGALIVLFASIRASNPVGTRGLSFVNMLFGAWVFASPWIYGYTGYTGRFINSLCIGVIVFVLGAINASLSSSMTAPPPIHPTPPPVRP